MSESKHCILCHETVWFGAYGTSKRHIVFKLNECYDTETMICEDCKTILNELPVEATEEEKEKE